MKILIINGPNLGLLGVREPEIYGRTGLSALEARLRAVAAEYGAEVEFFQSNHEGAIVDHIDAILTGAPADGIVINPAAYTHTSIAIGDALRAVSVPAIEVHISHIAAREEFRHRSLTAPACKAMIAGFGLDGYEYALRHLLRGGARS